MLQIIKNEGRSLPPYCCQKPHAHQTYPHHQDDSLLSSSHASDPLADALEPLYASCHHHDASHPAIPQSTYQNTNHVDNPLHFHRNRLANPKT